MSGEYEIFLSKADFKFNCAHFIAHSGFREKLHGHNYRLSVKVIGGDDIGYDGYLVDFGDIKKVARTLCSSINEYFICPMKSNDMVITVDDTQLCLTCEDGAKFSFPKTDCAMLPLYHSSAEELAHYFWCQIIKRIGIQNLKGKGIKLVEVSIAEAPQQIATYRGPVPIDDDSFALLEQIKIKVKPSTCFDNN
eukprot:gene21443-27776_t